jgi:hypothetical protein
MLTMRALLASALLLAACSRREARVVADPVDAGPPRAPLAEDALERFMVGARIVAVRARKVTHDLIPKPPLSAAIDRDSAYVVRKSVVHAFDSKTGAERWKATPPQCHLFAMTTHELFCAGDHDLHAIAKSNGALRTIAGATPVTQLLGVGTHLIAMRSPTQLESYPEGASAPIATISAALHPYRSLVLSGDGFCGAASVAKGAFAGCWSATLTPRWTRTIVVAKPGDPSSGYDVRRNDHGFFEIGTLPWTSVPMRSVILRVEDGEELARVDDDVAAVTSRNGRDLHGLVSTKKGLRYLAPSGTVRWSAPTLRVDESADALIDGDHVFVASYPSISSGASLHSFDSTTGALLWTHVPAMPPIAHSVYLNEVELAIIADTLVMRGHEAGVEYASLLDRTSGAAHLNTTLPLWGP